MQMMRRASEQGCRQARPWGIEPQGIASVVRQRVMALLPGGGCTAALVARHLGVDRRTLHRHLAAQGQSFSGLLQELRRNWVHKHVRHGQLPLADCVSLLGFASQSAFAYWFRCQFGGSVSWWRRGGEAAR